MGHFNSMQKITVQILNLNHIVVTITGSNDSIRNQGEGFYAKEMRKRFHIFMVKIPTPINCQINFRSW